MKTRTSLAFAVAAAALLAPGPSAEGGDGFLMRRPLLSLSAGVSGGIEAWLRVTNGHRVVQGFSVWFRGVSGTGVFHMESAALWMASPGETDLEEVVTIPVSENGSGLYQIRLDSSFETNPEIPLGAETVLNLERGLVEVRITRTNLSETTILEGRVGPFRWDEVDGRGNRATRSRRTDLQATAEDEGARATLRSFRRRTRGDAEPAYQGFSIYATGLTEDETYEVWIQTDPDDPLSLEFLDMSFLSTADGLGFFSFDTREGDLLPDELGVEDVRDLYGLRLELRRSGFDDPSLVGFFPRLR